MTSFLIVSNQKIPREFTDEVEIMLHSREQSSNTPFRECDLNLGEWVLHNIFPPVAPPYPCCGHDWYFEDDIRDTNHVVWPQWSNQCPKDQHKNISKWRSSGGHACYCHKVRDNMHWGTNLTDFTWSPHGCELEFDPVEVCQILGDRNFYWVGDSIQGQSMVAFQNIMSAYYRKKPYNKLEKKTLQRFYSQFQFRSMRDHEIRDFTFNDSSVVIFNVGPHINGDTRSHCLGKYKAIIEDFQEYLPILQQRNIQLIWRATYPGHLDCGTTILNTYEDYTAELEAKNGEYEAWNAFPDYNKMMGSLMHELQIPIVDVKPLELRADGHPHKRPDCLHWCAPGPLDLIAPFLYKTFLNLAKFSGVD